MPTIRESIGRKQAKRVREAHKETGPMELTRKHLAFKLEDVVEDESGLVRFTGMANVATVDRTKDLIPPDAWRKALPSFMEYGATLYFMHDWGAPIGRVLDAKVTDKGLYIEGGIEKNESPDTGQPIDHPLASLLDYARMAVKKKLMRSLSVGIRVMDAAKEKVKDAYTGDMVDARILKRVELLEISLVTIPASRESVIAAKNLMANAYGTDWAEAITPKDPPHLGQLVLETMEQLSKEVSKHEHVEEPRVKLVSLRDDPQPTKFTLTNLRGES